MLIPAGKLHEVLCVLSAGLLFDPTVCHTLAPCDLCVEGGLDCVVTAISNVLHDCSFVVRLLYWKIDFNSM